MTPGDGASTCPRSRAPLPQNYVKPLLDERQITHLICARLKYDLYDFFRGCFGPFIQEKERKQAQNTP